MDIFEIYEDMVDWRWKIWVYSRHKMFARRN